jgi:hypothetical protein
VMTPTRQIPKQRKTNRKIYLVDLISTDPLDGIGWIKRPG